MNMCLILKDEESVHEQFQKFMTQLNKSNDAYDLSSANSIYGAKHFPFLQVSCTWFCIPLIWILGPAYQNGHMCKSIQADSDSQNLFREHQLHRQSSNPLGCPGA